LSRDPTAPLLLVPVLLQACQRAQVLDHLLEIHQFKTLLRFQTQTLP
jgi:hypothetical protein